MASEPSDGPGNPSDYISRGDVNPKTAGEEERFEFAVEAAVKAHRNEDRDLRSAVEEAADHVNLLYRIAGIYNEARRRVDNA